MAILRYISGERPNVATISITQGQFIYTTDTSEAFFDTSYDTRMKTSKLQVIQSDSNRFALGDNVSENKVYYVQSTNQFYIYTQAKSWVPVNDSSEIEHILGDIRNVTPTTITIDGERFAPMTVASNVYTEDGETVEAKIRQISQIASSFDSIIVQKKGARFTVPVPNDDYFNHPNLMLVFIGTVQIYPNRYTLEGNEIIFHEEVDVGRTINFYFVYNTMAPKLSSMNLIDGAYINKGTIPIDRLAKYSNSYNVNDTSSVATSAALKGLYDSVTGMIDNGNGTIIRCTTIDDDVNMNTTLPSTYNLLDGNIILVRFHTDVGGNPTLNVNGTRYPIWAGNGPVKINMIHRNDEMAVQFDSTKNRFYITNGLPYLIDHSNFVYTATGNEDTISFANINFNPGTDRMEVFYNGIKLIEGTNFTFNANQKTITLSGYRMESGDTIEFVAYRVSRTRAYSNGMMNPDTGEVTHPITVERIQGMDGRIDAINDLGNANKAKLDTIQIERYAGAKSLSSLGNIEDWNVITKPGIYEIGSNAFRMLNCPETGTDGRKIYNFGVLVVENSRDDKRGVIQTYYAHDPAAIDYDNIAAHRIYFIDTDSTANTGWGKWRYTPNIVSINRVFNRIDNSINGLTTSLKTNNVKQVVAIADNSNWASLQTSGIYKVSNASGTVGGIDWTKTYNYGILRISIDEAGNTLQEYFPHTANADKLNRVYRTKFVGATTEWGNWVYENDITNNITNTIQTHVKDVSFNNGIFTITKENNSSSNVNLLTSLFSSAIAEGTNKNLGATISLVENMINSDRSKGVVTGDWNNLATGTYRTGPDSFTGANAPGNNLYPYGVLTVSKSSDDVISQIYIPHKNEGYVPSNNDINKFGMAYRSYYNSGPGKGWGSWVHDASNEITFAYANTNAWWIKLGPKFGNLIIQGGSYPVETNNFLKKPRQFPIAFTRAVLSINALLYRTTDILSGNNNWYDIGYQDLYAKVYSLTEFEFVTNNTTSFNNHLSFSWLAIGV